MRKLVKDFGDFINKGNVLTIAIGLVMALYFQKIVNAFMDGIINPIIACGCTPGGGRCLGGDRGRRAHRDPRSARGAPAMTIASAEPAA